MGLLSPQNDEASFALVYPLFQPHADNSFPDYLIPTAIWSANSFQTHTDILELDSRVIFFVEHSLWADKCDLFKEYGVRDEDVITFYPRASKCTRNRFSKALLALTDHKMQRFKRMLICDCGMFAGRTYTDAKRFSFAQQKWFQSDCFGGGIALMDWNSTTASHWTHRRHWWDKFDDRNENRSFNRITSAMNRALPINQSSIAQMNAFFPEVDSHMIYVARDALDGAFKHFVTEYEPRLGETGNIFHLWWRITGQDYVSLKRIFDMNDVSILWTPTDFIELKNQIRFFFSHIYPDVTQDGQKWESRWRAQVGATI